MTMRPPGVSTLLTSLNTACRSHIFAPSEKEKQSMLLSATESILTWVTETFAALDEGAKITQLFCFHSDGDGDADGEHDYLTGYKPGGIIRMFNTVRNVERQRMDALDEAADVLLLVAADLEGSRMSLRYGTAVPNPLALATIDDEAEGFELSVHELGTEINTAEVDLVLYLMGEETLLTRGHIFLDWVKLCGSFVNAMQRTWHTVPTAMISFGYPYYLYGAPRMQTYVNAYATIDNMQKAVVELFLSRADWQDTNPVDPFVGAPDARY